MGRPAALNPAALDVKRTERCEGAGDTEGDAEWESDCDILQKRERRGGGDSSVSDEKEKRTLCGWSHNGSGDASSTAQRMTD